MKILHIIPSLGIGGTEKILYDLCKGLPEYDHSVLSIKKEEIAHWGNVSRISYLPDYGDWFLSPKLLLKYVYEGIKPDLICSWLTAGNTFGRLMKWKYPHIPLIANLRVVEQEKLYHKIIEGLNCDRYDTVIVNCEAVKQYALDIGVPKEKIVVIHNGIEVGELELKERKEEDPIVVGTVGRLHYQKGIDIFLKAARELLKYKKEDNIEFRVYTVGKEKDKRKIEKLANRLGISNRVKFFYDICPPPIKELDIFVLCSRWEGFPNALLEAMALGIPVVASHVDGVKDLQLYPDSVFQSEQYTSCAGTINNFIVQKGYGLALAKEYRGKLKENFSMEKMIKSYREVFESFIK